MPKKRLGDGTGWKDGRAGKPLSSSRYTYTEKGSIPPVRQKRFPLGHLLFLRPRILSDRIGSDLFESSNYLSTLCLDDIMTEAEWDETNERFVRMLGSIDVWILLDCLLYCIPTYLLNS